VFTVVEDDQRRPPGQVAHDELNGRVLRRGANETGSGRPEYAGHSRPNPLGLGDARELDQPGPVSVLFAQCGGGLYRQPSLAHPPGPISVTSRLERTVSHSFSSSALRPTKLLNRSRRLPVAIGVGTADDGEVMRRLLARAALEHRSDDTADIIAQRLALYHEVTSPIISWYSDRGILVSVDAMRPAQQVGREILIALEAMRPLLDHVPPHARRPLDLTSLGDAFGATDPTTGRSG
jgi:hypothetical protein